MPGKVVDCLGSVETFEGFVGSESLVYGFRVFGFPRILSRPSRSPCTLFFRVESEDAFEDLDARVYSLWGVFSHEFDENV